MAHEVTASFGVDITTNFKKVATFFAIGSN